MVPVLSSTTVSKLWAVSSASPDLIRIPFSAPLPVPTMIATGVARPKAQGQLITRTLMAQLKANSKLSPHSSQKIQVASAISITTGTNTPAILSAVRAMGALLLLASSTSRMIWLIVLSSPTRFAVKWMNPVLLIVALITSSPGCFSTGMLSPVIAASSTLVLPLRITPSAGIFSPGRTTISSPSVSSSTGTTTSAPSRTTVACFGARSISFSIALEVRPLERASSHFPKVIRVTIMPADSKYRFMRYKSARELSPWVRPQLIR